MRKTKQRLLSIALSFFLLGFSTLSFAKENINISGVWISEAPPTVSIMAAYARLENTSKEKQTLVSISSTNFSNVELHLSKVVDGMAIMEMQKALTIPANDFIELSPGAYHLMLFNPKVPLKAGDTTTITFTFADEVSTTVEAIVKKRNNNSHEHHQHNH